MVVRARKGASMYRVPKANILQLLPDAVVPSKQELAALLATGLREGPAASGPPSAQTGAVHGTTFYHKGPLPKHMPEAVHQLHIEKREGG